MTRFDTKSALKDATDRIMHNPITVDEDGIHGHLVCGYCHSELVGCCDNGRSLTMGVRLAVFAHLTAVHGKQVA